GRNECYSGDANFLDHGAVRVTETTPVGCFDVSGAGTLEDSPGNQNHYGLSDLSGNVSEWMSDPGGGDASESIACYGGSYMYALPRISERFSVHPHFTDPFRGFRVVSTFRESVLTAVRIPLQICVCDEGT
ncbi:MAG: SUMF1/EgtB/PvdO family nonheme iron enzyme, partial [Verrucomicrobia bacterium]|nr:SUMF1/EgtB/PvdO family nonheme iron enzyme [Verrucomicrobiota bacterium]